MKLYKKKSFNIENYSTNKINLDQVYYGLPKNIEYCKKCLVNNQKPIMRSEHSIKKGDYINTVQFKNGICEACRVNDLKKNIDWEKREYDFKKLLDKYRSRNGNYDVIVPGSGGKDSFYVSHQLKFKYKMNPLTVTFSPFIYTSHGFKNLTNWTLSGFENILNTPNQNVYRLLSRISLENMFHPWHPWILGQKNFPPKFALEKKVPLVIYGDSPSEYGSPLKEYNSQYDIDFHTCENLDKIQIAGENLKTLKKFGLKEYDLYPFIPMLRNQFKKNKIKCLAYSYFHKWHPQNNYYYTIENSNFTTQRERTSGTYTQSNSIDDKLDDLYFYTYYIKFGMGRTVGDVSQEIRNGDLDIEDGKHLIRKYDGEYPEKNIDELLKYLSIDEKNFGKKINSLFEKPILDREYFEEITNHFRSPHLWKYTNKGFKLRKTIDDFFNLNEN